ncbi:uncharacterized protein LODBEIA_P54480 [Lodderomyces beijingensis]|uniref:MARVEL domain-containing protein n=1 Tax=Lodderomyces beijingensis TaxID=1775926 RepID=A0ABP0ZTK2_9ASCO
MKLDKGVISIVIRGVQLVLTIISLALGAAVLNALGYSFGRVAFTVAASVLTLLYLAFVCFVVPKGLNGRTPSLVIIIGESIFAIFYLAAWASIADFFPSTCDFGDMYSAYYYVGSFSENGCRLYQAILPMTLLNFIAFVASLGLFIHYSYIPEMKSQGFNHTVQMSSYLWGCIYPDVDGTGRKAWFGQWGSKTAADEEKAVGVEAGGVVADGQGVGDGEIHPQVTNVDQIENNQNVVENTINDTGAPTDAARVERPLEERAASTSSSDRDQK